MPKLKKQPDDTITPRTYQVRQSGVNVFEDALAEINKYARANNLDRVTKGELMTHLMKKHTPVFLKTPASYFK